MFLLSMVGQGVATSKYPPNYALISNWLLYFCERKYTYLKKKQETSVKAVSNK